MFLDFFKGKGGMEKNSYLTGSKTSVFFSIFFPYLETVYFKILKGFQSYNYEFIVCKYLFSREANEKNWLGKNDGFHDRG